MAAPPDIEDTLNRLLEELHRLPRSENALEQLGILLTLLERRTRYVTPRAGLIMTICCMLGLLISSVVMQGLSDISLGRLVTTIVVLLVALAVVGVLDFRLRRRPIPDERLEKAYLLDALKQAERRRDA